MERFFKKMRTDETNGPSLPIKTPPISSPSIETPPIPPSLIGTPPVATPIHEVDLNNLPSDPGLRPNIMSYPVNLIEQVRRAYLVKGPCQPREHDFPYTLDGGRRRKFVASWFDEFKDWLEYSIAKDAAYCLYCYLFSTGGREQGHDSFVSGGFSKWRKKERLRKHVGSGNYISEHKKCRLFGGNLMKQVQHIEVLNDKVSTQSRMDYRCRLNGTLICLRYLLAQGLPFRGNDESDQSLNQGNFIEMLKVIAKISEVINNVVLKNAPENLKLTSPLVQKELINAAAIETTKVIIKDLGNDFFSILVDECRDVSIKEQMGVAIRYVNKCGCVIERFLGLVHVSDTTALSLEKSIYSLFSTHGLNISSLRGQSYDGASNMRGEFNGLKSLILKKSPSAYYVHCFAHQLQLTLVAVAKDQESVGSLFKTMTRVTNIVGRSCKRRDMLRDKQMEKLIEGIENDEIETKKGLNLKRSGYTRWSSHYGTLINFMHLFSSVIDVLEYVHENANDSMQRIEAAEVFEIVNRFDFVFTLHLMVKLLGITLELSQILQRKDQDIVNAMRFVKIAKARLQAMRDNGWEDLLGEVVTFCCTHDIVVPDMEALYVPRGRSRRNASNNNLQYYRVEVFYCVIDKQGLELNSRFNEANTELLLCMACFDPRDSFSAFDKEKLLCLAKYYPSEFSGVALYDLGNQLDTFIFDVRLDESFSDVKSVGGLAQKMIATKRHIIFPLVFLLLKLTLVLPVATATVERVFSAMKIIKSSLRNRVGDGLMNDCLVTYIESDVFINVTDGAIMQRYMRNKREMLPEYEE